MPKIWNEQEVYTRDAGLDMRNEVDGSNNVVYVGRAFPGAADSEAKWQIYKMAYDTSNNLTKLRWANGDDKMDKVWDSRSTYTYIGI